MSWLAVLPVAGWLPAFLLRIYVPVCLRTLQIVFRIILQSRSCPSIDYVLGPCHSMHRRDVLLSAAGAVTLGGCSVLSKPAKYYVTEVSVSERRIQAGDQVSVQATVENRGDETGDGDLVFFTDKIGQNFGAYWTHTEGIELDGGESRELDSTTPIIEVAGEYSLEPRKEDYIREDLSDIPSIIVEGESNTY